MNAEITFSPLQPPEKTHLQNLQNLQTIRFPFYVVQVLHSSLPLPATEKLRCRSAMVLAMVLAMAATHGPANRAAAAAASGRGRCAARRDWQLVTGRKQSRKQ